MNGRVLAGRFQLTEILGQGGMGSVWRAKHLELGTDVAVKLMDPSLAASEEGVTRFRREAQAAASLQSPHVVQVFDYGVDGDTPYIAMEMLKGESLAKRIERLGQLSPTAAASVLCQVARALGKAHDAGIVHRDLKPENIFLVVDEDTEIAKVLDFGIAKRTGLDNSMVGAVQTQTGTMLGTPYYMSPEQAAGKKDVDHRSDIWSFGVIACECLIGRHFFRADTLGGLILAICTEPMPTPSTLGPVPPQFDNWFAGCVARDKLTRFQSIREAAAALESVCRGVGDVGIGLLGPPRVGSGSAPARSGWPTYGLLGPTQDGSTQSGPTSLTVKPISATDRLRPSGLWIGAAVMVTCAGLFVWLGRSTPTATPVGAAPPATEVKSTSAGPATPSPQAPSVEPAPLSAASIQPVIESSTAQEAKATATRAPQPHEKQLTIVTALPAGPANVAPPASAVPASAVDVSPPAPAEAVPQTPTPPAGATRPTAAPSQVDLAF